VKLYKPKSLILCGGVARNKKLRTHFTEFSQKIRLTPVIPSLEFCTDNAAMVAALALEKIKGGLKPSLSLDLNAYPRLPSFPLSAEQKK
jgi:N6-L-threonylcarbamoyladenine synthase